MNKSIHTIKYIIRYLLWLFGLRQVLPKEAIRRIPIRENHESLVEVAESQKIKTDFIRKQYDASKKVRKSIAEKLEHAALFLPENINLVLIEGYRSLEMQQASWDVKMKKLQEENPGWTIEEVEAKVRLVVARPNPLANHNCGGAVDVTLVYNNGELVDMGTEYPNIAVGMEVQIKFPMFAKGLTEEQIANRKILRTAMEKAGFTYYPGEWWHYCYGDQMWAAYMRKKYAVYGTAV